jgi:hypothetical protein
MRPCILNKRRVPGLFSRAGARVGLAEVLWTKGHQRMGLTLRAPLWPIPISNRWRDGGASNLRRPRVDFFL